MRRIWLGGFTICIDSMLGGKLDKVKTEMLSEEYESDHDRWEAAMHLFMDEILEIDDGITFEWPNVTGVIAITFEESKAMIPKRIKLCKKIYNKYFEKATC